MLNHIIYKCIVPCVSSVPYVTIFYRMINLLLRICVNYFCILLVGVFINTFVVFLLTSENGMHKIFTTLLFFIITLAWFILFSL